ncbi:MAG: TolC family protein [Planctomycetota bacterium]|jgi:cobalt-zinc-cadmium efflux system outer membrane protein
MRLESSLILLIGLLLVPGCAGSRVATRSGPAEQQVAQRPVNDEEEHERSAPTADDGDASDSVQRVSLRRATSDEPIIPAPATDAAETHTLDSLEQIALTSNPTLRLLQARVDAANGRWLQVGLYPNPEIAYTAPEIGNEGTAGQQGAYLQQEFVTADKLQLNRNAAAWDVKRVEQELAAQRLRVLTDVRQSFYAVLVAQERVKVAEELHDIAQTAVEKAKELVKIQEPQTVLTQAEIEAELAVVLVENSRTQREAQWRALAAVLGQPHMPVHDVTGELTSDAPQIVWDQTLERIHRESPELAAATAEVEESRWALQRASVQAVPNITVQAGSAYDLSTQDPIAMLQVSVPIPVYDRNQGGIAEAHANIVAAEQTVERTQLALQRRLAAVYQQYEQARQQATRYEETILRKAKANLDLNRKTFEAGESAYLPVLTAQRSYTQARLAWLNALEQLWTATVQMEGLLLRNSLE